MPTLTPHCGPCGPQWYIQKIVPKEGSIYTVSFDALNVTRIVYDVVRDCDTLSSGQHDPTSSVFEIDLGGVSDGKAFFVASCPNCVGFCQPFEFEVVHNGTFTPSVPQLRAAISDNNVQVFWEFGGSVDAFELQATRDGENWTNVTLVMSANIRQLITGPWVNITELRFRMRARKGANYSDWSNIAIPSNVDTETAVVTPSLGNVAFSTVRTDRINIVQDPVSGLWSDSVDGVDGDYRAFYYLNGRPMKSPMGDRVPFVGVALESGLVDVEKIYLHKDYYPTWASWENLFWKTKEKVGEIYVNDWWVLASSQQRLVIP